MSDIKLFQINKKNVQELPGRAATVEKSLQATMEAHLESFLGIRFLASEYVTGKKHRGRIDTLGLDENGCPVIIEYKRAMNENVINQGLFYLDWLLDHKAEFQLLTEKILGKKVADDIEWSGPRLICIAGDFTRYDEHAVAHMNRNIELIRYRKYGNELLLLELVNAATSQSTTQPGDTIPAGNGGGGKKVIHKHVDQLLRESSQSLQDLYEELRAFLLALGDDVQEKTLKFYFSFKTIRNFVCVDVKPRNSELLVYVKVAPDTVEIVPGFMRDVRTIGHFGTGDLELAVRNKDDLERAKPFMVRSYESA